MRHFHRGLKVVGLRLALLACGMTLLCGSAIADNSDDTGKAKDEEPIEPDRPDFTDGTDVVGPGTFQIESGYTFSRQGTQREHSIGEVFLRGGIDKKTEWRLALNSYVMTRDPGAGVSTEGKDDLMLAFKRVLKPSSGKTGWSSPAISIIGLTSVPGGARPYREKWQPGMKLCLNWDLSETTSLSSNLNYIYASDNRQRFHEFDASLSLGHQLSDRVGSFLEIYGTFPADSIDQDGKYVDSGLSYLLNNDSQIDVRLGIGLSNGVGTDYFTGAGFSHRF